MYTVKSQITPEKEVTCFCTLLDPNSYHAGSIPVTLDFANILNLNVLLLPVGRGDDGEYQLPRAYCRAEIV